MSYSKAMKILLTFAAAYSLALLGHAAGCADAPPTAPDATAAVGHASPLCRVWTTCDGVIRTSWVSPDDAAAAIDGCEAELACRDCGERSACATECP